MGISAGYGWNIKNSGFKTKMTFSRMNRLTGAGSIFALFGNSYRYDEGLTGTDIDRDALASDWQRVGEDIRAAMAEMAEMDEPTFSVRPIR
jgi:hypothetical protein